MAKNNNNLSAPYIDQLIYVAQHTPVVIENKIAEKLIDLFHEMSKIEIQGGDELRSIWIEVKRGGIKDFGSYKEYLYDETVSSYKEFTELWRDYYPDKTKWLEFSVARYKKEFFFYIDSKLTYHIESKKGLSNKKCAENELIGWLYQNVRETIKKLKSDSAKYNEYVKNNLPYCKRFGRILRSDYWKIFPEEKSFLQKGHSKKSFALLEKIVEQSIKDKQDTVLKKITSGDYFNFCKISYDANEYFKDEKNILSPKEMYLRFADGRDCGLRKLNLDSESDYLNWYMNDRNCGGHPWEICRGGNSTHISLFVEKLENGWILRLAGSSRSRANETSKIAIALYRNNIPFKLDKADEIYRMLIGNDQIGIVPENIRPVYCHHYFPKEDRINDFMNLGFEYKTEIIKAAYWYPINEIRLI